MRSTRPTHLRASAALLLLVSCTGVGGIRPRYGALPESVRQTLDERPLPLTQLLDNTVRAANLPVVSTAPREGYLETAWFDAGSRQRVSQPFANMDRVVKLRFFVDSEQGRTRLLAEAVYRIAWDPSVPERELERMVPAGHPGRVLLDSIVAAVTPTARPAPLR